MIGWNKMIATYNPFQFFLLKRNEFIKFVKNTVKCFLNHKTWLLYFINFVTIKAKCFWILSDFTDFSDGSNW